MKKLLFILLLALSTSAAAETCKQIAVRLATDLNGMHKNGASVADVRKRFDYSKDLEELAALYMTALIQTEPDRGWSAKEYPMLAQEFAKQICTRKQK